MKNIDETTITQINLLYSKIDCNIKLPTSYKISKNFTLYEMMDPTTNELIFCPLLLEITQSVRDITGWEIWTTNGLSWYRGFEYNQSIGGVKNSLHTFGQAIDTKCYKKNNQIHPVHVAYAFLEEAQNRNVNYEIGVYFPKYNGTNTGGYVHFGVTDKKSSMYYYDSKGIKYSVDYLHEIKI